MDKVIYIFKRLLRFQILNILFDCPIAVAPSSDVSTLKMVCLL